MKSTRGCLLGVLSATRNATTPIRGLSHHVYGPVDRGQSGSQCSGLTSDYFAVVHERNDVVVEESLNDEFEWQRMPETTYMRDHDLVQVRLGVWSVKNRVYDVEFVLN